MTASEALKTVRELQKVPEFVTGDDLCKLAEVVEWLVVQQQNIRIVSIKENPPPPSEVPVSTDTPPGNWRGNQSE